MLNKFGLTYYRFSFSFWIIESRQLFHSQFQVFISSLILLPPFPNRSIFLEQTKQFLLLTDGSEDSLSERKTRGKVCMPMCVFVCGVCVCVCLKERKIKGENGMLCYILKRKNWGRFFFFCVKKERKWKCEKGIFYPLIQFCTYSWTWQWICDIRCCFETIWTFTHSVFIVLLSNSMQQNIFNLMYISISLLKFLKIAVNVSDMFK